jgi:hypothetical protein
VFKEEQSTNAALAHNMDSIGKLPNLSHISVCTCIEHERDLTGTVACLGCNKAEKDFIPVGMALFVSFMQ